MERVTLIIQEGPGNMKAWNGLRLAAGLIGEGMDVYMFLLQDGTYAALKGQKPVDGLKEFDLAGKITELIGFGVQVQCCSLCAEARGISADDLVEGVSMASMIDLARSIKESKHVISF